MVAIIRGCDAPNIEQTVRDQIKNEIAIADEGAERKIIRLEIFIKKNFSEGDSQISKL